MYPTPGHPELGYISEMQRRGCLFEMTGLQNSVFHAVGPAVEAAQVVKMGVAQIEQLGGGQCGPAAGAAVDQDFCVLIRKNFRQIGILDLQQTAASEPNRYTYSA